MSLSPGQHYLFTNNGASGYSGSVTGDQSYGTGFTDFGASNFAGIQLLDGFDAKQDGVGSPLSPCREGTGIVTPTANGASNAYARVQETDNNAADFSGPQASNPAQQRRDRTALCQRWRAHLRDPGQRPCFAL
jgi:hypothetical protein